MAETRTIEVLGRAATVFGLTGADGTHGLRFDAGERWSASGASRFAADYLAALRPTSWRGNFQTWSS